MAIYDYRARAFDGSVRHGARDGENEGDVLARLRAEGLTVSELRLRAPEHARPGLFARIAERILPVRSIDVELGLQQVAFLLESGVSLLTGLGTAAEQAARRSAASLWRRVAARVLAGEGLADALRQEKAIPEIAIAMASVGESTGELGLTLSRAAESLARRRALVTSLLTALTYPAIVVVLCFAVVAYMMVVLIPKLTTFLAAFGRKLPPITQALVDMSRFAEEHVVHGAIGLAALALLFFALRAWPPARMRMDRAFLRLPIVGKVQRLAATGAFARNMSLLLSSGVRLTESLRTVEPLVLNRWISARIAVSRQRVLQGVSLTQALAPDRVFEPLMTSAVSVGELGGNLDDVFAQVADYHDTRLEARIRTLSVLVEPVIVVVVGGIVGFVYLAFFLAIYSVAGHR